MSQETHDTIDAPPAKPCAHMCSFGCGNEYEFITTTVTDSTTQLLCVPCFIGTAMALVTAITEPDNPEVQAAVAAYDVETVQATGKRGRKQSLIAAVDAPIDFSMFDPFEPDVTEDDG